METKQYTISEAAKKLHVGSHVLRFWEEELHLNIPRNEMGHRVYSEKERRLSVTVNSLFFHSNLMLSATRLERLAESS